MPSLLHPVKGQHLRKVSFKTLVVDCDHYLPNSYVDGHYVYGRKVVACGEEGTQGKIIEDIEKKCLTFTLILSYWSYNIQKGESMSISKNARCSQIIKEVGNGKFVKNNRFHNFGSVVEDSIMAQQARADERLREIQAQRKVRVRA